MANFPFENADFAFGYANMRYPKIDYDAVYYTNIGGVIMAVKPIAYGVFRDKRKSGYWHTYLRVLAADGQIRNLERESLYYTSADAIEGEKGRKECIKFDYGSATDAIRRAGGVISGEKLISYFWSNGEPYASDGGFMFWVDKDGEHISFSCDTPGSTRYRNKDACVDANIKVLDFGGEIKPELPKGVYTIRREFTVKADSQEEADAIMDKVILEAYKNQNIVV